MLDFINPEEFDYSWLPEEELQVPDSIASEDLQTAILKSMTFPGDWQLCGDSESHGRMFLLDPELRRSELYARLT